MSEYNNIEPKLEQAFQKVFADAGVCPNNFTGLTQSESLRPLIYSWCQSAEPLVQGAITGNYRCRVELGAETIGESDPAAPSVAPAHNSLSAMLRDTALQDNIVALMNAAAAALGIQLTIYDFTAASPSESIDGPLLKSTLTIEVIAANATL